MAGSLGFKEAITKAGVVVLEPISLLKVSVPAAFQGDVMFRLGDGLFGGDGVFRGLNPMVGGMGASNGALYGYGGLAAPFQWGKFEVEACGGVGAYHRGNGYDLGGTFEFHLGLGFSYAIADGIRAGIALTHISNANTHRINPGLNSALATIGLLAILPLVVRRPGTGRLSPLLENEPTALPSNTPSSGTMIFAPNDAERVVVSATTMPLASTTERCVVCSSSRKASAAAPSWPFPPSITTRSGNGFFSSIRRRK